MNRLQREKEVPTVKSLESDIAVLVEEIRGLKKEQNQVSGEVNQLKSQKDQLGDKLVSVVYNACIFSFSLYHSHCSLARLSIRESSCLTFALFLRPQVNFN